jgi:hypothetical protein
MLARDTSPEVAEMQSRIHKSMTGEQRLLLALEMSHFSHSLMKAGIHSRHPDWSTEQVTREFRRLLFFPAKPPGL